MARSNFHIASSAASPRAGPAAGVLAGLGDLSLDGALPGVVVVVDALSTGACVADYAQTRGYSIVHVVSLDLSPALADCVPGHLKGGALKWKVRVHGVPRSLFIRFFFPSR